MRRIALLLLISIALAASACVSRTATLAVHRETTRCPRPERPDLPTLDPDRSLCAPDNLDALLELFDRQRAYADQLAACVDCYEAQGKEAH